MNKVSSIIQARTGSSRLPGKVLEKLGDESVIEWIIYRSKKANNTDEIILATTLLESDDILCEIAEKENISTYRGDTDNVLQRYYNSAIESNTDIIVRICADRPFIDPRLIDSAVNTYNRLDADIVFNHISDDDQWWPRGFGVEVFSTSLLKEFNKLKLNASHKEHVTLYAWQNRDEYKIVADICPDNINPEIYDLKLDLDTNEDLERLRDISKHISLDSSTSDIIDVWKKRIKSKE